jgi:MYXO-CTERM domain-containing protein
VYQTPNFAIWYGDGATFDYDDVVRMGDAFEWAWEVEVDQLGHPTPVGTDTYRFNVYAGGTGTGVPESAGVAGYMSYDHQNYPYILMNDFTFGNTGGDLTSAHEFYHAVQDAFGTYEYHGTGAWYFEATASWIEVEVYPDDPDYASFLFGFAYLPETPLNAFRYPMSGALEEYHQYGAFIFPKYLSEFYGGPEIVRRSWEEGVRGGNPLDTINSLLVEQGQSIEQAFVDFAGRNATWDYEHGGWYRGAINGWPQNYYDNHRVSGELSVVDHKGVRMRPEHPPQTYGANYWMIEDVQSSMTVAFEGDPGPRWSVAVAWKEGAEHFRQELPVEGDLASGEVTGLEAADEVWVVVAAVEGRHSDGTAWSYDVIVSSEDEAPVDPITKTDAQRLDSVVARECACSGSAPSGVWPLLGVLAALARRRSLWGEDARTR